MDDLEILTRDLVLKDWEESIKPILCGYIKRALQEGSNGKRNFKKILYELFTSFCVKDSAIKSLTAERIVDFLKEETLRLIPEASSTIADIFWFLGNEIEDTSKKDALIHLIKVALEREVISANILKERLEFDLLLDLFGKAELEAFKKRVVRYNTKYNATQQKFNLLREESEGYSKLIQELEDSPKITSKNIEEFCRHIQSLIGYFDLDPNRVMDIALDAYESNLDNDNYIKIISLFKRDNLAHILGFKFQFYQSGDLETPRSLYRLAAALVKHKLLTLEDLYPHLKPDDAESLQEYNERKEISKKALPKSDIITLSGDKEGEKDKSKGGNIKKEPENQKFGLVVGLLEMDVWSSANTLLRKLFRLDPASNSAINQQLCQRLHNVIAPYYSKISMKNHFASTPIVASPVKKGKKDILVPTDELLKEIFPLLKHIHLHLHEDILLFAKVCRLIKEIVKQGNVEEEIKKEIEKIISKVFLPALSLLVANPGMNYELWDLLKSFPYTTRYRLYGGWKSTSYSNYVELIKAKQVTLHECKKAMKRLAKENVKPLGRVLGKISHSHPVIVFGVILDQIQQMDSLIQPVVDALKYATPFSLDVLSYLIVETLASSEKDRLKSDGTNIAGWLSNIAVFTGTLFRKYPQMELLGILQYVVNQLKDDNSLDLLVLKELIGKMSGIELMEDVSDSQLEAQAGGEILRLEGYYISARNLRKPTQKLRDTLVNSKLVVPLLILISQQRNNIIFNTKSPHLKLIGDLFDKCHETLIQFVDFLVTNIPADNYAHLLPGIVEMVNQYQIEPEVAFHISRPVLSLKYDNLTILQKKSETTEDKKDTLVNPSKGIVNAVKELLPQSIWSSLSPQLFVTFWSLSIHDIYVPKDRYEEEIKKLQSQIQAMDEDENSKKKKEKERLVQTIAKLKEELGKQEENCKQVIERISKEKDSWLASSSSYNDIIISFLQTCIFPRCTFSQQDAIFCSKFLRLLHEMSTPYFSTLQYFDKVFKEMLPSLLSCTENEASRLGRFLFETMSLVQTWKNNETIYNAECMTKPGFFKSFVDRKSTNAVTYDEFVRVTYKWHSSLTKDLSSMLDSKEYMEVRNTLIVLNKIVKVFPTLKQSSKIIEQKILRIKEDERADIKVLASRYHALLEQQKKNQQTVEGFHGKVLPNGKQVQSKEQKEKEEREDKEKDKGKEKEKEDKEKDKGKEKEKEHIKEDRGSRASTTRSASPDRRTSREHEIPPLADVRVKREEAEKDSRNHRDDKTALKKERSPPAEEEPAAKRLRTNRGNLSEKKEVENRPSQPVSSEEGKDKEGDRRKDTRRSIPTREAPTVKRRRTEKDDFHEKEEEGEAREKPKEGERPIDKMDRERDRDSKEREKEREREREKEREARFHTFDKEKVSVRDRTRGERDIKAEVRLDRSNERVDKDKSKDQPKERDTRKEREETIRDKDSHDKDIRESPVAGPRESPKRENLRETARETVRETVRETARETARETPREREKELSKEKESQEEPSKGGSRILKIATTASVKKTEPPAPAKAVRDSSKEEKAKETLTEERAPSRITRQRESARESKELKEKELRESARGGRQDSRSRKKT